MEIVYRGIYAALLREFVDFKRHCGFRYNTEEKVLLLFDRLTMERKESKPGINRDLADAWGLKRDNESDAYRYKRCITLNQFSLYLNRMSIESSMSHAPKPKKNFTPHIYTQKELERLFEVCDSLKCDYVKKDSLYVVMPALIRFLSATGVRIGEALALKIKDINLKHNYLILSDTKNRKERLLPFTASLSDVLKQYAVHRDGLKPVQENGCFFVTARGRKCHPEQIYKVFRKVLDHANIPFKGGHYGPNT